MEIRNRSTHKQIFPQSSTKIFITYGNEKTKEEILDEKMEQRRHQWSARVMKDIDFYADNYTLRSHWCMNRNDKFIFPVTEDKFVYCILSPYWINDVLFKDQNLFDSAFMALTLVQPMNLVVYNELHFALPINIHEENYYRLVKTLFPSYAQYEYWLPKPTYYTYIGLQCKTTKGSVPIVEKLIEKNHARSEYLK